MELLAHERATEPWEMKADEKLASQDKLKAKGNSHFQRGEHQVHA